jgi:hypothetical protein
VVPLGCWLRRQKQAEGDARMQRRQGVALACVLWGRLGPAWQARYVKVEELWRHAVRARSAVEGGKSGVRRPQGRQRHVRQERLELTRV